MGAGSVGPAAGALRDVMRPSAIRRIEIAWTAGTAADWAFLVILLVVAYDAGGAFAVGLLGAIRVLPAIVAAPLATTLLERFRGNRVLTAINLLRAVGTLATAIVIATDFPIEVTYALAAIVAGAGSLVRPIQSALLPALARSPGELVAANVASSTGEGIGTFVGPLLAGILVTWTGSAAASLLVAGLFAAAAAAVTGLRFERDADAHGGRMAGSYTRFQLTEAVRILRAYPGPATVVGDFVAQTVVRGLLTTLIVIASIEVLEMGDAGVGLLNAAIGLGSLAGAIGALSLVGTTRLTLVFTVALAGWSLPLVLIGAWPIAALALCALFVTGVSNAVLDVSGSPSSSGEYATKTELRPSASWKGCSESAFWSEAWLRRDSSPFWEREERFWWSVLRSHFSPPRRPAGLHAAAREARSLKSSWSSCVATSCSPRCR